MDLDLRQTQDGLVLAIIARPGAKRSEVAGVHAGALKVSVTAAPEKGKANKAIVKLLAKRLGVAPSAIAIVGGEMSRKKKVRVLSLQAVDLVERLGLGGIA